MRSTVRRNNVNESGDPSAQPILFSHGYGCDQKMWRFVAPEFEDRYRVILFDHVGFGESELSAWDPARHATLRGYADDVLDIIDDLELSDVVFVGHSVASMIGVLAANERPDAFAQLVLLCPSPRYIDDPADGYVGGFSAEAIEGLVAALDVDLNGWAATTAPMIMGNPDVPALTRELAASFCRTDPRVASAVARATFLSDFRTALPGLAVPTSIIRTSQDVIAPPVVGEYMHDRIEGSELLTLRATGHCPHLSAPTETAEAIWRSLASRAA